MVPQEDVWPLYVQLPDFPPGEFLAPVRFALGQGDGAEFTGHVGEEPASAPHFRFPVLPALLEGGRGSFAEAVALLDADAGPLVDGFDEVFRQGGGSRVRHADGTEVVLRDAGMFAQE